LCFSADETRRDQEQTVRLEAAAATAPKAYAWQDKLTLQFTSRELPQVLAVLMGWLPSYRVSNHGEANDKGCSFENQQGGKLFVSVWQGKSARAVPVMAPDVFPVMDLVIKQLLSNSPHLTPDALLSTVRALSQRYLACAGETRPSVPK
jgi:hypothetical protein